MLKTERRHLFVLAALLAGWLPLSLAIAAESTSDLSEFRTVATAVTTQVVARARTAPVGQTGYLGVSVEPAKGGKLAVVDVEPDSPAAKAGLKRGDLLLKANGRAPSDAEELRDLLGSKAPGDDLTLTIARGSRRMELVATLAATSRPLKLSGQHVLLGLRIANAKEGDGAVVVRLSKDMPAAKAGLKVGDVIVKTDGTPFLRASDLSDTIADKAPGEQMAVTVRRGGVELEKTLTLAPDPSANPEDRAWYNRKFWKKETYRLAVVPVEFADMKRNATITARDWSTALFSAGTYASRSNATGQAVFGSVNDYYREMSSGAFRFDGKIFDWVKIDKKRGDFMPGTSRTTKTAFFTEALDALLGREGTNTLAGFDGLLFIYAGDRVPQVTRGSLYWPHRGNTRYRDRQWPYVICPEGGSRMSSVSLFGHEFGHLLGLPDLYARPENPGSEGAWVWCAMSNQITGGRPQHFSAWCKEQLGWLKPAVIDPTVKQKLILAPVEGSTSECFKVLARPDGSEYFLLENRRKKGFDQSLPSEGLLIWRVVHDRPFLEESHGVEGPMGPRVYLRSVPYPSAANNAFTPHTKPSSRAQLGGGLPVHITRVRQLDDGRVTFHIGYAYE
ncbi:MAG: M6 family metalloprotease domain-containing protein [Verrucomicrobia bacterium]|nr:M6 family metalloprotease domain-containing protein [Verrucomicrobiota bacterium]